MPDETPTGDTTPLTFDSPSLWTSDSHAEAEPPTATTTSTDDAAANPPEGATTPRSSQPPEGAQTPRDVPGPVPFERHKSILESERREHEAKWQRVAWANELVDQGATKEQVQRALGISSALDSNPTALIEQLLNEAINHPALSQQVRSVAARVLGNGSNGQGQRAPDADAEPQADLYQQNEDGTRTLVYSDKQLAKWNQWNNAKLTSKFEQELAPFKAEREQRLEQQRQREEIASYERPLQRQLDELNKNPRFVEHFDKVKAYIQSMNNMVDFHAAWIHVLHNDVLPTLDQTSRAKERADLRTQAAANSVSPRTSAASRPGRYASFDEIPKDQW